MRTKTIKIPLYFEKLKVCVVEKLANPEYEAYVTIEKGMIVVYLEPGASASIIAHEAVHIANFVFKNCGVKLDLDNDEPQAYLIGWIVKQITNFLNPAKK